MDNTVISRTRFGLFTKSIVILLIVFHLLSYLNKNFNIIFANMPLFTMFWSELWRLITGPFITENLQNLLLNLSLVSLVINLFENREGTLKTFKSFWIHIILIQLLNIALILIFTRNYIYSIKPLVVINLAYLLQIIFLTKEKHLVTFNMIKINNRMLFAVYLVLFICLNFTSFFVETLVVFIYGFWISKYKGIITVLSDETVFQIEKHESIKSLVNIDGYITLEDAKSNDDLIKLSQDDEESGSSNTVLAGKGNSGAKPSSSAEKTAKKGGEKIEYDKLDNLDIDIN